MTVRPLPRRIAALWLASLLAVAALASFLASDMPLLLSWEGRVYVLPNVIEHEPLRDLSGHELRARMTRADWALWPPVPHDPGAVRSRGRIEPLAPPSAEHPLGTDDRGRDVLARLIHGTRATLAVAAGAALLSLVAGVLLALLAARAREAARTRSGALAGRAVAAAVITACDAVAAMPALLVVVAAQALLGHASLALVIALIALPRAADTARITRGALTAALAAPYCEAARALGASHARVLVRHALPQAAPQLAVATALTAATAVLAEAALSFLGFGVPPPAPSWGELLRQAHENQLRWHLVVPAGLAVALTAAALGALAQPHHTAPARTETAQERA